MSSYNEVTLASVLGDKIAVFPRTKTIGAKFLVIRELVPESHKMGKFAIESHSSNDARKTRDRKWKDQLSLVFYKLAIRTKMMKGLLANDEL